MARPISSTFERPKIPNDVTDSLYYNFSQFVPGFCIRSGNGGIEKKS